MRILVRANSDTRMLYGANISAIMFGCGRLRRSPIAALPLMSSWFLAMQSRVRSFASKGVRSVTDRKKLEHSQLETPGGPLPIASSIALLLRPVLLKLILMSCELRLGPALFPCDIVTAQACHLC
ncbi:hypothetical protein FKP32DRAFT_799127 [Trametes sanguinea]|nr:hypothetical protein FKP32DRAFT_799127 [Trametes sanguinea]